MAADNTNRTDEREAERAAEIDDELERIDRDPDAVDDGDGDLGTQNAPRDAELGGLEDAEEEPDEPV